MYYTQDQIDRANQADLVSFLQSQGKQFIRDPWWGKEEQRRERVFRRKAETSDTELVTTPSGYRPGTPTNEQRGTTSQQSAALMKM